MNSKIAILLPVYNAEEFLRECLDSMIAQTYTEWELFACNDGSTDSSLQILNEYAAEDRRITILDNPENMGVVKTLNRLLKVVPEDVDFIARMDADDIALPDRLEKQIHYMQKNPHIDIVGGQLEIIDEKNNTLGYRRYATDPITISKNSICANPLAHPTVFFRKELINVLKEYRNIPGCEDYDLWLRAIQNGAKPANLPDVILRYRISAGQIKQRDMKKSLYSTIKLQWKFLFCGKFFSFKALVHHLLVFGLFVFPDKILLKLFMKVTYRNNI